MKIKSIFATALAVSLLAGITACRDAATEDSGLVVLASESEVAPTSSSSEDTTAGSSAEASSDTSSESSGSEPESIPSETTRAFNGSFELIVGGVTIKPNIKAQPVIDALGSDYTYFEADSCASLGVSKTYTYMGGAFSIITEPLIDKEDTVYQVVIYKAGIMTPEGISVGSSRDDVIKVYGDPLDADEFSITYDIGDTYLMVTFDDNDLVDSITYGTEIV